MFENPRRGRQARYFTTNVPKILVLKSSSEQIFSRKLPLGAPEAVFDLPQVVGGATDNHWDIVYNKKRTAWLLVKLNIKSGEVRIVSWKVAWDKRLVDGMATQQNRNRNLVAIIITQDSYSRHHEVDHRRTVKSVKEHLNKQQRRKAGWQFVKAQDYPAYGSKPF